MFRFSLKGLVSLALAVSAASCSSERDSQTAAIEWNLVGEYLGQQPPGSEVELFAPGFVSTAMSEANSVFTPDGSEFFFAVSLTRNNAVTLSVYIVNFFGRHAVLWGEVGASSVLVMAPLFVLSFVMQRYLVRGLTLGAVK